jgi:hypothetical protein
VFFTTAFGLIKDPNVVKPVALESTQKQNESINPTRTNEVFKLSKVTSELQNGAKLEEKNTQMVVGCPDRKLTFFQPNVNTYSITRSLQ